MDTGLLDAQTCEIAGNEDVVALYNALCELSPVWEQDSSRWDMCVGSGNSVVIGPLQVFRAGNACLKGKQLNLLLDGLNEATVEEREKYVVAVKVS